MKWLLLIAVPALAQAASITPDASASGPITLDNGVTKVVINPAIGGRVMAYVGGGRSWLWTDPAATPLVPTSEKPWLYGQIGGFHLWPAPQARWKRANLAGWPPPGQIDHGVYELLAQDAASVELRSPIEDHADQTSVGLRAELRYRLAPNSTRLTVESTFINTGTYPQWWAHWHIATVQLPDEHQGCVTIPVQANSSAGPQGYLLQSREPKNTDVERSGDLVRCWWNGKSYKISSDSEIGWLAAEDRATNTVFVQRFSVEKNLPFGTYPEGHCPLAVFFGDAAGFTEMEIMGPERELAPGATTTLSVEWASCRVAGPLTTVTEGGVTVRPLTITNGRAHGSFGVFDVGTATLTIAGTVAWSAACTPNQPLEFDVPVTLSGVATLSVNGLFLSEPTAKPEASAPK